MVLRYRIYVLSLNHVTYVSSAMVLRYVIYVLSLRPCYICYFCNGVKVQNVCTVFKIYFTSVTSSEIALRFIGDENYTD